MPAIARASGLLVTLACSSLAHAANGLNLIGVSTESIGMGGADVAVARDTFALNSNPAGLTQINARQLDVAFGVVYRLDVSHEDGLGNDAQSSIDYVPVGSFGYAASTGDGGPTWGIGLFAQGGAGYEYQNLITAIGTRDDLISNLGIAKLSAGAAYAASPGVSLGASAALTYAQLDQKVLPDTSVYTGNPATSFFGYTADGLTGLGVGVKLGVQYRPAPNQTWGIAYTFPTTLDLSGGSLESNQSALGLGYVRYNDVRVTGLQLPRELGIGYARQETPGLLWTVEHNWLDWSSAMQSLTVEATDPSNPASPPINTTSPTGWRDQYVLALGLVYSPDDLNVWRAGYNYGRNPIPPENLSPLLATITEHHFTFGYGRQLGTQWRTDVAVQYNVPNSVTYTNPRSLFGPNAIETYEVVLVQVLLSRNW
jgi:long-chain fatty acid transport protein